MDATLGFGDALGPVFLMPHPTFGPKNIDTLRNFIQELPKDISLFTELRNPGWYSDPDVYNGVFSMLEENEVRIHYNSIHNVYFFMHQHEEIHSPELSRYLIQQLNKVCGTSIPEPQFVAEADLYNQ